MDRPAPCSSAATESSSRCVAKSVSDNEEEDAEEMGWDEVMTYRELYEREWEFSPPPDVDKHGAELSERSERQTFQLRVVFVPRQARRCQHLKIEERKGR